VIRKTFGVLALALLCAAAHAQDAVTIKFADPKAGDRVKVEEEEEGVSKTTVSAGGKDVVKEEKGGKKVTFVEEVVTAGGPGKRPTKLTRTYERADFTKGDKTTEGAPLKTAIVIEKIDGKYSFSADGKPVGGVMADELNRAFNRPDVPPNAMFPDKPVKAGESWKVDLAKAVPDAPGMKFDREKGKGGGTLVRTEKRDGALFGVFELVLELPITEMGAKGQLELKPTSSVRNTVKAMGCIDGTNSTGKTVSKSVITIEGTAMGATIVVKAETNGTKTVTPFPEK
jgi:hypothetical protein